MSAADNRRMHSFPRPLVRGLSPRTIGIGAAVITVLIWTSFILIARASADPARGGTLNSFDIAFCRIVGASLVLLPWGAWLVRCDRRAGQGQSSLFGLSPLSLRITATVGLFGGLLYALLAYGGFVFAPAAHASVLLPGSLPLWTALLAALLLTHAVPGQLLRAPLPELLFLMAIQGWGSVVISGITFTKMIQHFGPVRSTMITALVPGLSALGAVLLLGEPLHWNLALGLALVTGGILFGVRAAAKS
jgi:drug/metabolite transporter (DMT)-like permease